MYEAKQGTDGKLATSWVEGAQGAGLGESLKIEVGEGQSVRSVKIWAGMWFSHDFWTRANRPKEVELRFADGSSHRHTLKDEMVAQVIELPKPVQTSFVEIRLKSVYGGTTWLDTAISEVQVFNDASGSGPEVAKVTSSSQLADDGDGNYNADNMLDGIKDSMWCEGSDGNGSGEWVEVQFAQSVPVSKLSLINGIGSSLKIWMQAHKVKSLTLQFDDGSSEKVAVKKTMMAQTVSFPTHSTRKVRVLLGEVDEGPKYDDLCLTELSFGN
jgi:hypothetical protein